MPASQLSLFTAVEVTSQSFTSRMGSTDCSTLYKEEKLKKNIKT